MAAHSLPKTGFPLVPYGVALTGIFAFSVMDAIMKGLTLELGAYNAMVWRNLTGWVLIIPLFALSKPRWPPWQAMRLHLLRGSIGAVMAFTFFWGIARIPLAEGIAISFVAPLVAIYLSALFLKERLRGQMILASAIAFAGVAIIAIGRAQGSFSDESVLGIASVLVSSVLYAINIVLMRAQAKAADPIEVTFWQTGIALCVMALFAPWLLHAPPAANWPMIGLGGMLTVVALTLLSWAYGRAETQQLVTSEYTALIWACIFGWVLYNEPVAASTVFGSILIIAGCFMATRQQGGAVSSGA